jgi:ribosomal protein S18 acetylase RimI-like enzyme
MEIVKIEAAGYLLQKAITLIKAYQIELNENLCFQDFDKEMENPLYKYSAPTGALLIAMEADQPIGCVAIQALPDGSCEMKRLYVIPTFRHLKIGDQLVLQILKEAIALGYQKMKLDTLERLVPAIKLYEKHGFVNVNAYYLNPLPTVVYMEKQLANL